MCQQTIDTFQEGLYANSTTSMEGNGHFAVNKDVSKKGLLTAEPSKLNKCTQQLLGASCEQQTHRQYAIYLKKWKNFCENKKLACLTVPRVIAPLIQPEVHYPLSYIFMENQLAHTV